MALFHPGETVAGRYRIERELGSGGFGEVYEATELTIERHVAIKVLRPDDGRGYKALTKARFVREAKAVGNLQSPHTVKLLDFGEADGKFYMAFELVPGEDLRTVINREGRLDPPDAENVLKQLLDSLGEAHRAGILHRDIKPANIRVFPWGDNPMFVKLLDFGLARPTDKGSPGITETGELLGTPRYMSPEQLQGAPLTPASDIYSLGVVFLEMLVGAAPLQGNRWSDQFDRMMTGHVFSFPELERIGPRLMGVIHRMTARDLSGRFASVDAVAEALRNDPQLPSPRSKRDHRAPRRDIRPLIAALVTLGVLISAIIVWQTHTDEPAPTEQRTSLAHSLLRETTGAATNSTTVPVVVPDLGRELEPDMADSSSCGGEGWSYFTSEDGWIGAHYVPRGRPGPYPVLITLTRERASRVAAKYGEEKEEYLVNTRRGFVEETKLMDLADREGVIIMIPPGELNWNERADIERTREHLDFLAEKTQCVDPQRVYVVGDHLGAVLAYMLSESPWVAAVAVFGFALGKYYDKDHDFWNPRARPIPFMWIVPKNSKYAMLPVGAASTCFAPGDGHARWVRAWSKRNHCNAKPVMKDGCQVFGDCEATLVNCEVPGGYHWPGTHRERDKGDCGVEDFADIALETKLWEFFADKRLK